MILDATASNRAIYETKECKNIVYLDVEKKLERKPTIFADNTQLPFRDEVFDTVFYDPPYYWLQGKSFYGIPDIATWKQIHPDDNRKVPVYYGVDKVKSRGQLIANIYRAFSEFNRTLKRDGLVWFKWCNFQIPLRNIINFLIDWIVLIKLKVSDSSQVGWFKGENRKQTFWVCFAKKGDKVKQERLFP
jgi:hypothetical protein